MEFVQSIVEKTSNPKFWRYQNAWFNTFLIGQAVESGGLEARGWGLIMNLIDKRILRQFENKMLTIFFRKT